MPLLGCTLEMEHFVSMVSGHKSSRIPSYQNELVKQLNSFIFQWIAHLKNVNILSWQPAYLNS